VIAPAKITYLNRYNYYLYGYTKILWFALVLIVPIKSLGFTIPLFSSIPHSQKGTSMAFPTFDQCGYTPQADEHLKVDVEEPGDYYVMVHSYDGSGEFTLKAELV